MTPSDVCERLVKRWEALALVAYRDVGGLWTIGWGHLMDQTEDHAGETITAEAAEILFQADLDHAGEWVSKLVHIELTQNQYDALVSFVFNVGVEAFAGSTMHRLLTMGDIGLAAEEFEKWSHLKGLVLPGLLRRRMAEKGLFLQP